jgi:hypothetical protein
MLFTNQNLTKTIQRLHQPRDKGRLDEGFKAVTAGFRALIFILVGALVIAAGDWLWRSCETGTWKLLAGQASDGYCIEFWLNRYQTLLAGIAALLAAWIIVNAIRHQAETARIEEAERALNQYAAAILDVMQKYEAVPVALSHETRQDAERLFHSLNEATDAPTIRTALIDSVIGGDQPMIAQFLNCCRLAAASRVNARVERRHSNMVWPLYAALCDGLNRRKAMLRNGKGVAALYGLTTINPNEVRRAFVEEREPVWDEMRCT